MDLLILVGVLGLLIWLAMRGANLLVVAPFCGLILAVSSGMDLWPNELKTAFVDTYMKGFTGFMISWFFVFLLGSIFGKLMEDCGAAERIAVSIMGYLGAKRAMLAVVLACAVMTYGGVSVFVVTFTAFPIALSLFREANLPRRFIPAAMAFGSVTFTMTSAGSPEIQNWIPMKFLGTTPYAAWEVSLLVAIFMAALGYVWLRAMMAKAVNNGEAFDVRADDPNPDERDLPSLFTALIPMLSILLITFFYHESLKQNALVLALLVGCISAWLLNMRHYQQISEAMSNGAYGAMIALANTCAVVGFGTVAKMSPGFEMALMGVMSLPGDGLVSAAIAISLIAGITGSASGGQSIALPELAPHYLEAGVKADELHRIVSISSGALDSLPHNGYVVTTIRAICGEKHSTAYLPLGAVTVVVPIIGTGLALLLFALF